MRFGKPKLDAWSRLTGSIGLRTAAKKRPMGEQERFMCELLALMDRFEVSSVDVTLRAVSAKAGQPARSQGTPQARGWPVGRPLGST